MIRYVALTITRRQIMQAVSVIQISKTEIELQWSSNTSNDMIADSTLALLLGIDTSPAIMKRKSPINPIHNVAEVWD